MSKQKWFTGKLHWLDEKSGDGIVKTEDGSFVYIHKTALSAPITDGTKIRYQLIEDVTFVQVSKAVAA